MHYNYTQTSELTVFSWCDGWAFQSSGFDRRSQQDCLSWASFHDSGPWRERRQMRLEASDRNTGEFVGHREKPVADDAQCGLLPQTKPPFGFHNSIIVQHFYLCAIRLKSYRNHYITFLKRDCTGFALNIKIVVGFIVIMKCDLYFFFISYTLRIKWLPLKTNHRKGFLLYKKSMH